MAETFTIELVPGGLKFECDEDTKLLDAAVRAGLGLPYGCRKGNCGTCKVQVLDGEVDLDIPSTYSLSQYEQDRGVTLLCSAYACSDLVLEVDGLDMEFVANAVPPREIAGEVAAVEPLTHDIRLLRIALAEPMEFRAGQFAQVRAPGTDVWRSYSMANPPGRPDEAEFMIKAIPGGAFSSCLETLRVGQPITLNGPHGDFAVRHNQRPLLLVAGGAGMAPMWSMLQDLAHRQDPRRITYFYGARTPADLFHLEQLAEIQGALDLRVVVALSEATEDSAAGHRAGLVTDVLRQDLGRTVADHDAYLCGPPPMIDASLTLLEAYGLEQRRSIFFDKFSAS
jgi:propane monooxygenase reductase subunit